MEQSQSPETVQPSAGISERWRLQTLERLLALPATELNGALEDAANLVAQAFGADKVDAWLHRPDADQLVVAGVSKTPVGREELALGITRLAANAHERVAHVFQTGSPYRTGDAARDPLIHRAFVDQLGIRSILCTALEWSGRRRGVLLVSATRPKAYEQADLEFLQAVAGWVSAVAHRAELVDAVAGRREAEQALRARDEFMATISHDLQNPLTGIRGHAQLLERLAIRARSGGAETVPSDRVLTSARAIVGSVDQIAAQVAELLDLASVQAGAEIRLERRPTDLVALVRSTLEAQLATLSEHEVNFDPLDPTLVGQWDTLRLRRVIGNLVTNAAKYSPPGAPIHVLVERVVETTPAATEASASAGSLASARSWAVLTVRDHGIGIPANELSRVFERFHRASNVGSSIPGTGLGLASARHIIELHGGTIHVESEEGRGSTFTVRLPL